MHLIVREEKLLLIFTKKEVVSGHVIFRRDYEMLETIWGNIAYYTKVSGKRITDVYRPERFGKGISINSLIQIAETLDIPFELLVESDQELTRDVAWDIVCKELKMTRAELIDAKNLRKNILKLL